LPKKTQSQKTPLLSQPTRIQLPIISQTAMRTMTLALGFCFEFYACDTFCEVCFSAAAMAVHIVALCAPHSDWINYQCTSKPRSFVAKGSFKARFKMNCNEAWHRHLLICLRSDRIGLLQGRENKFIHILTTNMSQKLLWILNLNMVQLQYVAFQEVKYIYRSPSSFVPKRAIIYCLPACLRAIHASKL